MLKMFTTQLIGQFKKIQEEEDFALEDGARLLSQALIGEGGAVYIHGSREMNAVSSEALFGKDHIPRVQPLMTNGQMENIDSTDRVLLISRYSSDQEILTVARELHELHVPIVAMATLDEENTEISELADVFLNLHAKSGLVPTDTGERVGYPASLLALYTYFALSLLISEIIAEND